MIETHLRPWIERSELHTPLGHDFADDSNDTCDSLHNWQRYSDCAYLVSRFQVWFPAIFPDASLRRKVSDTPQNVLDWIAKTSTPRGTISPFHNVQWTLNRIMEMLIDNAKSSGHLPDNWDCGFDGAVPRHPIRKNDLHSLARFLELCIIRNPDVFNTDVSTRPTGWEFVSHTMANMLESLAAWGYIITQRSASDAARPRMRALMNESPFHAPWLLDALDAFTSPDDSECSDWVIERRGCADQSDNESGKVAPNLHCEKLKAHFVEIASFPQMKAITEFMWPRAGTDVSISDLRKGPWKDSKSKDGSIIAKMHAWQNELVLDPEARGRISITVRDKDGISRLDILDENQANNEHPSD